MPRQCSNFAVVRLHNHSIFEQFAVVSINITTTLFDGLRSFECFLKAQLWRTMTDTTNIEIDPRLLEDYTTQNQPRAQPAVTLPSRNLDNADDASDAEGQEGGAKRRKLNLLKCKQCRDARKKVESTCDLPFDEPGLTSLSASPRTVSGHRNAIVAVYTSRQSLTVRNLS
jgi:hypothetical protein